MTVFLNYDITTLLGEKVFEIIKYIDPEIDQDILINPDSISEELKLETLAQKGIFNYDDYMISFVGDLIND